MKIAPTSSFCFAKSYNSISEMKKDNKIKDIAAQEDIHSIYEPGSGIDVCPLVQINKNYPSEQNVEEDFLEKQKVERVLELMETLLNDEQRTVLEKRFGLDGSEPKSRRIVAQEMGMTENMVRTREDNGLLRLKIAVNKDRIIEEREAKR